MTDSRIVAIESHILPHPKLQQVIVEVTTDDGLIGTGESWWGIGGQLGSPSGGAAPIKAAIDELVAPHCIGMRADAIGAVWHKVHDWGYRYGDGGIVTAALSGVDIALWDRLGLSLERPVHALLGGAVHESVPAYASLPPLRELEVVVSETLRALEYGFRAVKLHEIDPEIVHGVRQATGDEVAIMVDVNGAFATNGAIDFGRAIAADSVLWYEEPVSPMRSPEAMTTVRDHQPIPLAGGENEYSLAEFDRLLRQGIVRWLQPEITKIGGLTAARKVATLAELHNTALSPHNFRLGPSLAASIHWAFASPTTEWVEIPWLPADLSFPFSMTTPALHQGAVEPPMTPGLGLG